MYLNSIPRPRGCEPRPRHGHTDQRVFSPSSEGRQAASCSEQQSDKAASGKFILPGCFAAAGADKIERRSCAGANPARDRLQIDPAGLAEYSFAAMRAITEPG